MEKTHNISLPKGKKATNVKTKIVDGNIEVSYDLEDVFEPKDGDFVTDFDGDVFIVKDTNDYDIRDCYVGYSKLTGFKFDIVSWARPKRYSTMQEKQSFLERLEKECKQRWNPETKQLEDIRWIPYHNQEYWYINEDFVPIWDKFSNKNTDHISRIKSNNCFKTEEAAQKVADQIKEIFKNSKAE